MIEKLIGSALKSLPALEPALASTTQSLVHHSIGQQVHSSVLAAHQPHTNHEHSQVSDARQIHQSSGSGSSGDDREDSHNGHHDNNQFQYEFGNENGPDNIPQSPSKEDEKDQLDFKHITDKPQSPREREPLEDEVPSDLDLADKVSNFSDSFLNSRTAYPLQHIEPHPYLQIPKAKSRQQPDEHRPFKPQLEGRQISEPTFEPTEQLLTS